MNHANGTGEHVKRKTDVATWIQAVIAAIGLTGGSFAWYTNQSSKANAAEVVQEYSEKQLIAAKDHNDRSDSHYQYRRTADQNLLTFKAKTNDKMADQANAITKLQGAVERLDGTISRAASDVGDNRTDIKEILRLMRIQQAANL